MGKGYTHDRNEALTLFKAGLDFKQVAKRMGCVKSTASKIRRELIAWGKLDDLEDPVDRELEDQSFRNIVHFYAEEIRDIHRERKCVKDAVEASSRALFKYGAIEWKRDVGCNVTERALRVLEEVEGGKRDGP